MKLSPMMEQYLSIKKNYEDCILFFRLGDFYEMFFEDAKTASRELELTLTGKNCGLEERAPMCGVPFHSAETYIGKLVEKGYKVAICEQTEDPKEAKGIVKRDVIKIVTAGTVTSQAMLKEKENNYLLAVFADREGMAISYCDISTGELYTTEWSSEASNIYDLVNEIAKISPSEIIINEEFEIYFDLDRLKNTVSSQIYKINKHYFDLNQSIAIIKKQFNTLSLAPLDLQGRDFAVRALGAMLGYLTETQKSSLSQIVQCNYYQVGSYMCLDKATLNNLEITQTLFDKTVKGSLLGVLDVTKTAMGARRLKQWLKEPLNKSSEINERLDGVEEISENPLLLNNLVESLKGIYDFERLSGRIASSSANGRDLIALKNSLKNLPEIKSELLGCSSNILKRLSSDIDPLQDIVTLIDEAIEDEPPIQIREGGIIKDGFSSELDGLKDSIKDGKQWIADLENIERERTGIKNLKVGYNKVFGYFIDVTKSNIDMVPEDYIRKQTLVNNERYVTPKLKEVESLVLNAESKINQLEYEIFSDIRNQIGEHILSLQKNSKAISVVDVLCSFADVANKHNYCRPKVDDSQVLEIIEGRHPVIENTVENGIFVSNNAYLDDDKNSLAVITGPNMAGKSTYMRQTALIVLLAQSGSFVPCKEAKIGVVDRIFTRIGASDNLSQGQSTFYVEMSELAYILNCATKKSLIILDEIGRGTSTYDGLSIAWATVEYLCQGNLRARTLFATHYHELTSLADSMSGVINLNVDVREDGGEILFLHKIIPGPASRSYGIHVAKLAGVPKKLLESAEEKLYALENESYSDSLADLTRDNNPNGFSNSTRSNKSSLKSGSKSSYMGNDDQISFFAEPKDFNAIKIKEKLKGVDLMEITPSKAIAVIEELKELLDD